MERIEINSAHDLPGAEITAKGDGGRQALRNYAGRYELDSPIVAAAGEWEHDAFVARIVEHADGERARIDRQGRIIPS